MDASLSLSPLSLVTPVVNYQFEKKAIKKQLAAQKELAQFQFDKNLEMWNIQNEYNTPASQMARYQQAGLNPHLVAGQGSSGNATSIPSYQLPSVDRAQLRFDNALDTILKVQAISRNKSEIEGQNLANERTAIGNSDLMNKINYDILMRSVSLAREEFNQRKREWELDHNKIMGSKQEERLRLQVFRELMETAANYETWDEFLANTENTATIKANQADASQYAEDTAKQRLYNLVDQGGLIQARRRAQDLENEFNEETKPARLLGEGINPNTGEVTNAKIIQEQVMPYIEVIGKILGIGAGLYVGGKYFKRAKKASKAAKTESKVITPSNKDIIQFGGYH